MNDTCITYAAGAVVTGAAAVAVYAFLLIGFKILGVL